MTRLLCALALLALTGCASLPQECDPANANAGFFNKAGCVYGGHYQQRVQERQAILLDEQKANALFRASYEALQQESAEVATDLGKQQASLDHLNTHIGALLAEIRSKATDRHDIEQQIAAVESQLQQLQRDIDNARVQGQPVSVLQQRQQMAELQVRVQDLQGSLGLR